MTHFELYDDRAGALTLCILIGGTCAAIIPGWQYQGVGCFQDAANRIRISPEDWRNWPGKIHDRPNLEPGEHRTQTLFEMIVSDSDLVAWFDAGGPIDHIPAEHLSTYAKKALNLYEQKG